jgi:tRNA-dihydrouridine synthase
MLAFGNLQLKSNLFLSPLAGYTNLPFRWLSEKLAASISPRPTW